MRRITSFLCLGMFFLGLTCKQRVSSPSVVKNSYSTISLKRSFVQYLEQSLHEIELKLVWYKNQWATMEQSANQLELNEELEIPYVQLGSNKARIGSLLELVIQLAEEINIYVETPPPTTPEVGEITVLAADLKAMSRFLMAMATRKSHQQHRHTLVDFMLILNQVERFRLQTYALNKADMTRANRIFAEVLRTISRQQEQVVAWVEEDKGVFCQHAECTQSCAKVAEETGISSTRAERLCEKANIWTSPCLRSVKEAGIKFEMREELCQEASRAKNQCIVSIAGVGILDTTTQKLCNHPAEWIGPCVSFTHSVGFRSAEIEALCLEADQASFLCIKEAREGGKQRHEIMQLCTRP